MAAVLEKVYTAEDLLRFPTDSHYELIEGTLRPMPMPTGDAHGSCTALFTAFATIHIVANRFGDVFAAETGFLLQTNPDIVKAPDFAFVAKGRVPAERTGRFVAVVPDLVLETRSPSDRKTLIAEKIEEWLRAGARIVLDLDPATGVMNVYRPDTAPVVLTREDTFVAEDILPGFALPLRKLFYEE